MASIVTWLSCSREDVPIEFRHTVGRGDWYDHSILGYPIAKAAIEMALYDLVGKTLNQPIYNLLGGAFRTSFPTWLSMIPLKVLRKMLTRPNK